MQKFERIEIPSHDTDGGDFEQDAHQSVAQLKRTSLNSFEVAFVIEQPEKTFETIFNLQNI